MNELDRLEAHSRALAADRYEEFLDAVLEGADFRPDVIDACLLEAGKSVDDLAADLGVRISRQTACQNLPVVVRGVLHRLQHGPHG